MVARNASGPLFTLIALAVIAPNNEGQEALRSAIDLDEVLEQRGSAAYRTPERLHIGPVQIGIGLYSEIHYDDNVRLAEKDIESDLLLRSGVNTRFLWPITERSNLRFGAGI